VTDAATDQIVLRDGTVVLVRPIRPTDAAALESMHARLSADSIYRRYFGARPHLSPATVARFTQVYEPWRFALVAVRETIDLVAVARYEGSEGSSSVELAMVVDDALQHRGVGRMMLERLIDVAVERGVPTLEADVLTVNSPMLALLRALGLPVVVEQDTGYNHLTVDLPQKLDDPQRRARAMAHIAAAREGAVSSKDRQ
jgi:GNAT superfamily N-acetyltransferase